MVEKQPNPHKLEPTNTALQASPPRKGGSDSPAEIPLFAGNPLTHEVIQHTGNFLRNNRPGPKTSWWGKSPLPQPDQAPQPPEKSKKK